MTDLDPDGGDADRCTGHGKGIHRVNLALAIRRIVNDLKEWRQDVRGTGMDLKDVRLNKRVWGTPLKVGARTNASQMRATNEDDDRTGSQSFSPEQRPRQLDLIVYIRI